MDQDPLQLVPVEKWSEIQSVLLRDWPRSLPGYNALERQKVFKKEAYDYGFDVYSLYGDYSNGYIAFNNNKVNYFELIIQYPKDDTRTLEKALIETKRIDWFIRIAMAFAAPHVVEVVQKLIKDKNIVLEILPSTTFIIEKGSPLFEDVRLKWKWAGHVCRMHPDRWAKVSTEWELDGRRRRDLEIIRGDLCPAVRRHSLPPGFTFEPITSTDHVDLINEKWPHAYPQSDWYFNLLINARSGYGLFKNGELACWIFLGECGFLTHLYTMEDYRKQGLATLMLKLISNELIRTNIQVFAFCVKGNDNAYKMYKKIGFKESNDIAWGFFKGPA